MNIIKTADKLIADTERQLRTDEAVHRIPSPAVPGQADQSGADERAKFEAWYKREYWDFNYKGENFAPYDILSDAYQHVDVNLAYRSWKAASQDRASAPANMPASDAATQWKPADDAILLCVACSEKIAPQQPVAASEPVAWANWKVGTDSYVPFRKREDAVISVNQCRIAATQEGPYEVVGLCVASTNQPVQVQGNEALRKIVESPQTLPTDEAIALGELVHPETVQAKALTDDTLDGEAIMLCDDLARANLDGIWPPPNWSDRAIKIIDGFLSRKGREAALQQEIDGLLASQPSAPADVAAVRDAALEDAVKAMHKFLNRDYRIVGKCIELQCESHDQAWNYLHEMRDIVKDALKSSQPISALKSTAPTAQPQADGVTK